MSEDHMLNRYNTAELYDSIILGLRKKQELIVRQTEYFTTEFNKQITKISELTGMDLQELQNKNFTQLSSPDSAIQKEINEINETFQNKINNAVHRHNNYCRAIDKRVEHLNDILAEQGRERI